MTQQFTKLIASVQRLKTERRSRNKSISAIRMSSETWNALGADIGATKPASAYDSLLGIKVEMDETLPFGEYREV